MVNLVLFERDAVEEAILNLLASAVSIPNLQPEIPVLVVKLTAGVVAPDIVNKALGVVVPMPTLPCIISPFAGAVCALA